ncbi:hypothetical protein JQU17_04305 [Ponticoccus sp. SC2-23]|uniref:hypothetical protein n=1 Tax=Alexandriicola marinus TaxID=2081710 RepID=UPI000FD6F2EE|nr:hypothetical protein [Alexandriicola marinus]MBM1219408.1 hypothetical protein [Ponticoccus sp. SC6-9]MBM1223520.1 hypothetical protein [Ponticoccus sp. SC6-15]MBM1229221.1 hypothetical protein [Ponticoccus sp. SC6-38]MBM1232486.1 hypothetical protein [Ponticoccus sp. SC6-45]MBM1237564.1 hypothetical protein [Ponticoccus sp. SC6-49]MBM1241497.1 hypothetical protein [Ponticoccus sp. SC2-64]MBM1246010.1 hypothetical protein [Ponticoccus sp. SC6-42]MBM1250488.1 hypothetical protein [Pontico
MLGVLLAACVPATDPPGNLAPAPMQLRDGVTVTVEGQALEVRRTLYRWVRPSAAEIQPDGTLVQPPSPAAGEFSDGVPAIAIDGLTPGPGDYETALSAILLACGFRDAGDAVGRGGLQGDVAAYAPQDPRTFYIRLETCPALDG